MDGGLNDLLNAFLNNPEMIKKAADVLSHMSADGEKPADAVPAVAQSALPQTQNNAPENPSAPNMSSDQLAAMVSSVISALGMKNGEASSASAPQAESAAPEPVVGAADAPKNFDIEKALGVLKNVSAETSPQKDNRIQLLLSLKPFMKDGRKQKIDMAVKYLNAAKDFNMIGKNGFI